MKRPARKLKPTLPVAGLVLMLGCAPLQAQEATRASTRVSPGGTTRVYVMAAFGDNCQTTGAPVIEISTPPLQGTVALRPGQTTTVTSSLSGKCIGAQVQGTGVYYSANTGAQGRDIFSIRARLSTGEMIERTFLLRIEE
jgi:hypothetical protein